MQLFGALASTFGVGFVYFLGAVPAGVALGLPCWLSALAAWVGYSAGGVLVTFAGRRLRTWMVRRFKIESRPAKPTIVHRAWGRFGLGGLGFLAPVTIGPQLGAVLGLALGASPRRLALALSLGAAPWAVAFALLVSLGVKLVR